MLIDPYKKPGPWVKISASWGVVMARTADIFEAPQHPYTKALISAVPNPNPDMKMRFSLSGEVADPGNLPPGCSFHPRCPKRFEPCAADRPALVEQPGGRCVACHLFPAMSEALDAGR